MASYRKGLTLSLGSLINLRVDLHGVIPSTTGRSLSMICPEHKVQVTQEYKCDAGNHYMLPAFTGRGRKEGDTFVVVNQDSKPKIDKVEALQLQVVPTKELTDHVVDGEGFFYCKPSTTADEAVWALVHDLLNKGDVALIARGPLRSGTTDKIWRFGVFRGYIVMRDIVFPKAINTTPERPTAEADQATRELVTQYVGSLVTSWSEIDTTDRAEAMFAQWVEAGDKSSVVTAEPRDVNAMAISLQEALRKHVTEITGRNNEL